MGRRLPPGRPGSARLRAALPLPDLLTEQQQQYDNLKQIEEKDIKGLASPASLEWAAELREAGGWGVAVGKPEVLAVPTLAGQRGPSGERCPGGFLRRRAPQGPVRRGRGAGCTLS